MDIKVPVLPESIEDATVAIWHKVPGSQIRRDEIIVEVETDKVMLEVPAETDGIMGEILHPEGDVVNAEEVLGVMEEGAVKADDYVAAAKTEASNASVQAVADLEEEIHKLTATGPAAKKILAEKDIAIAAVQGTGKGGRILKEDAQAAKANATVSASGARSQVRVPMSRLRAKVAERLLEATQQTAMLTTFNELDMSAVLSIRKKHKEAFETAHGVKLGFMSFFVKAAVEALKKFPAVNAQIDGNEIIYHGYCDVGVAVSSDRGLVVPVLRDAHTMAMHEIELGITDFAARAQTGKLALEEITGGTFTVSNGGVFGSMLSTPILNPPQSAILGMHKTEQRPVVVDGEIVIRPIMYLALSYDHRIIDGREAVLFLRTIKESLEDPSRLLLGL